MESQREFDDTEIGTEVPTGLGDALHEERSDLCGHGHTLLRGQRVKVLRTRHLTKVYSAGCVEHDPYPRPT
jgi:hypothetical protein